MGQELSFDQALLALLSMTVIHMLNNNENDQEIPIKAVPDGLYEDCEKERVALQEWQERSERRQRELRLCKLKLSTEEAA